MDEHREYSAARHRVCSSLQTPSSVGFQAIQDDVTTQTKPLGCHQPDIGIVIPTTEVTGKAVPGRTKTNLNILISMGAGKRSPDHAGLRTRLGGERRRREYASQTAPGAWASQPAGPSCESGPLTAGAQRPVHVCCHWKYQLKQASAACECAAVLLWNKN